MHDNTRVNQKVKAIFKLRGNRDREELPHCELLTMPVEEFRHAQYSALPSVQWQQRGRKHGRSFARLHHRRTWRSAVSLVRSETCGNSPSYVGSVWTEHHELTKGFEWVERFKSGRTRVTDEGRSGRPSTSRTQVHKSCRKASSPQEYRN